MRIFPFKLITGFDEFIKFISGVSGVSFINTSFCEYLSIIKAIDGHDPNIDFFEKLDIYDFDFTYYRVNASSNVLRRGRDVIILENYDYKPVSYDIYRITIHDDTVVRIPKRGRYYMYEILEIIYDYVERRLNRETLKMEDKTRKLSQHLATILYGEFSQIGIVSDIIDRSYLASMLFPIVYDYYRRMFGSELIGFISGFLVFEGSIRRGFKHAGVTVKQKPDILIHGIFNEICYSRIEYIDRRKVMVYECPLSSYVGVLVNPYIIYSMGNVSKEYLYSFVYGSLYADGFFTDTYILVQGVKLSKEPVYTFRECGYYFIDTPVIGGREIYFTCNRYDDARILLMIGNILLYTWMLDKLGVKYTVDPLWWGDEYKVLVRVSKDYRDRLWYGFTWLGFKPFTRYRK